VPENERPYALAALLKSTLGYLESLGETPEAKSIRLAIDLVSHPQIKSAMEVPAEKWVEASQKILSVLKDPKFLSLINPNIIAMLENRDQLGYLNYEYKVREVIQAVKEMGKFSATDQRILFREGVLNFTSVANTIGYVADFYAGRHNIANASLGQFIEQCGLAAVSANKTWKALSETKTKSGGTCGSIFQNSALSFYAGLSRDRQSSRPKDQIGMRVPSIVSTAIVEGSPGISEMLKSQKRYLTDQNPNLNLDFNRVLFGYWLPPAYAQRIETEMFKFTDGKSKRFKSLGTNSSWQLALENSPAEPGLSKFSPLSETRFSVGGWSDLHPVQVLKAAGCQNVIYVTRRTEESIFLVGNKPVDGVRPMQGISELLGLTEVDRKGIFDLSEPNSGFTSALKAADGVWCTDWNRFKDQEIAAMMDEAYNSEFVASDQLMAKASRAYPHRVSGPIVGCTP
jgi:hypothetical protein